MIKSLATGIIACAVMAANPAQAWTCLPFKSIGPYSSPFSSADVDYSPEAGWTVVFHPNAHIVRDWRDYVVIENIDGSQWRGTPTARHLPKFEHWTAAGKLYLGEDGVMYYTEQTFEPSGKLYNQVDLKCHKEAVS